MSDIVIHALASAAYAGLAWHFWNTRWSAAGEEVPAGLAGWERIALLAAILLHGWLIASDVLLVRVLRFGFAPALSVTLWLAVAIYWVESLFLRLDGFEPLILPLAALAAPLPALFPGRVAIQYAASTEFALHVTFGLLAHGVLVLAIVHVALMAYIERNLHKPKSALGENRLAAGALTRISAFPPLLTLERLLFRMIAVGFALFTLTLALGVVFSESVYGRVFRFDHKTLFSVLAWITLALLLVGRHAYGWRGRTALRWTMGSFVLLMLAYVGKSFVLEVVLGRT